MATAAGRNGSKRQPSIIEVLEPSKAAKPLVSGGFSLPDVGKTAVPLLDIAGALC